MIIKAEQKFVRHSPRKLRLVADLVRHLPLTQAQEQLEQVNKRAAIPLRKTLRQAVANAVNNLGLKLESLTIKTIQIGDGPTYKRWQPVSRGRAHSIFKRTSHIKIILESKDDSNPKSQIPVNPPAGGHRISRNPKQVTKPKSKKSAKDD